MTRLLETGLAVIFLSVVLFVGASESAEPAPAPPPQPAAAEKAAPPVVTFSEGLLSVSAKDADIRALVESISAKSGVEIVLDKSVTGKATAVFKSLRFEDGLKVVLREVVEGGFVSEYERKSGSKDGFDLQKVVIARQAPLPKWVGNLENKDILRIEEMYVGETKGEEVLFVPWGDGEGQIPIKTLKGARFEVRQGFDRLRVGTDGTYYFLGWAHERAWVYDKDGVPKGTLDLKGMRGNNFDIDHEGNFYLIVNPMRRNDAPQQEVFVYNRELKQVAHTWTTYAPGWCNVVRAGILRNGCDGEKVLSDFTYLLKAPRSESEVLKSVLPISLLRIGIDPLERDRPAVATLTIQRARALGIEQDLITAPYTQAWEALGPGSDHSAGIAYVNRRLYVLVGIGTGKRFHDDYGIGVVDLEHRQCSYYKLAERDSFVYEKGELMSNFSYFDVDPNGNIFQLLTTKRGVHIFKYRLGGGQ